MVYFDFQTYLWTYTPKSIEIIVLVFDYEKKQLMINKLGTKSILVLIEV